ncbi:hypothetical protein FSP39_004892 [Pinctada imbricata]|uniref:Uncharacterized protein n=1 Tax=Pinctada imbricata TaxID=66713 RepID=A0AA89BYP7_PINIB|nr:hypothetical protein FSP39_004892 [Pinctada imbricata]
MTEPAQTARFRLLTIGISTVVVLTLSTSTITTPLWLDSISAGDADGQNGTNSTGITNSSSSNSTALTHRLDNFTIVFLVNVIYFIISGAVLLVLTLCVKGTIPASNHKYPKSQFMLIGFSDAVSSIFFVYAADGSRTAPYLQSLVTNFAIPVTFIVRFIILRKRPTAWKASFAGLVLCAEFIALVPSIFPSLESNSSKKDDGGATGIAGVLWPLCYFIGYIPQAIVIVVLEKSTKAKVTSSNEKDLRDEELHPAYLLFWTYLFCLLSVVLLFWTNIIPGFGNTSSIDEFWEVSFRSSVVSSNREHSLSVNDGDRKRLLMYSTESYQSIDASNPNINDTMFEYQTQDFQPVEPYYLDSSINSNDSFR